jgi:hypothetical protein
LKRGRTTGRDFETSIWLYRKRNIKWINDAGTGREKGMDRVIEYRILYSSYIEDLQNQVNALLKKGWIPHSALCFGGGIYHQAMVLIERKGQ